MQDDGVQSTVCMYALHVSQLNSSMLHRQRNSHAVKEAQAESQLLELISQDSAAHLEHGELVGSTEDTQVPFNFLARSQRVQESCNRFLSIESEERISQCAQLDQVRAR